MQYYSSRDFSQPFKNVKIKTNKKYLACKAVQKQTSWTWPAGIVCWPLAYRCTSSMTSQIKTFIPQVVRKPPSGFKKGSGPVAVLPDKQLWSPWWVLNETPGSPLLGPSEASRFPDFLRSGRKGYMTSSGWCWRARLSWPLQWLRRRCQETLEPASLGHLPCLTEDGLPGGLPQSLGGTCMLKS